MERPRLPAVASGAFLVTAVLATGLPAAASAALPGPGAAAGVAATDVIVRYAPGAAAPDRGRARRYAGVRRREGLPLAGAELVEPTAGVGVAEAVRALERDPDVLYAELNAVRTGFGATDDTYFARQWALQNTGQLLRGRSGTPGADLAAPVAWDTTVGRREVVLAVVDSGTDTTHPDLAANLWRNPGESAPGAATNGLDDDANGFVDDVVGWDVADADASPADENGHGTHVAGIAGAVGANGRGVSGVAQATSLMTLRVLGADGTGTVADAIEAYGYAARNGARVVNLSLGGDTDSRAEQDAIAAASGVLFVAAAGNDGADNDVTPTYPCASPLPNVVCVAASDRYDRLAPFSNVGARSVDLAAPGVDILSTYPVASGSYAWLDGTSMATPQVAGVASLVLSQAPTLTVAQLRATLLGSVDVIATMQGKTVTGGRVDAARALAAVTTPFAAGTPPATAQESQQTPVTEPAPVAPPAPLVDASPAPDAPADPAADVLPAPDADAAEPADAEPTWPASDPGDPMGRPPATDRSAPRADVRVERSPRLSSLRRRGLRVSVTCSEACAATASAAGRSVTVVKLRAGVRRTVVLRLPARASRTLAVRDRLVLRVAVVDAAGNVRRVTRTLTLRR